jgi:type IV secretory pathway VirJ component
MFKNLFILLLPLLALIPVIPSAGSPVSSKSVSGELKYPALQQSKGSRIFEGLPVVAFAVDSSATDFLVLVVSGDGGWNVWEESLRKEFNKRGVPVVGLDALKYFWKEKTPEQTTSDLSRVLNYYLKIWKKENFFLLGYSFGANIVPFIATRLKEPYKTSLLKTVLISPDPEADFEIHLLNMMNMEISEYKYNVADEVKKIKSSKILCLFGASEDADRKKMFRFDPVQFVELPGKHHFKFDFPPIVGKILEK